MVQAFLSHSFDEHDRKVVGYIRAILEAKGFQITSASPDEMPDIRSAAEKLRSAIGSADCLIAIVTTSSSWIQNEIGMAYMVRKPVYVISEGDPKDIGGIASYITDAVTFERNEISRLNDTLAKLLALVTQHLYYGTKLNWYGEAVNEVISQLERSRQVDILGRSTETYFDALNPVLKSLALRRAGSGEDALKMSVFFVPSDEDPPDDIRCSAKRVLEKWQKVYRPTSFFVLPREYTQIRAILFERDTGRGSGFAGTYSKDAEAIYLGVTHQLERFDHTSAIYQIMLDRIDRAHEYDQSLIER